MAMANHPILASGTAAEPSVARTEVVYLAKVDEDGHVNPDSMKELTGFPDQGVGDISFTGTGGLVVSLEGGSAPGIYYRPPDGRRLKQLTSGADTDSMGFPRKGDRRFVFTRHGDLYLAQVDGKNPECATTTTPDEVTGTLLCRLTSSKGLDEGPAWSWDGESIAFVTRASEDSTRILKRLDLDPARVEVFSDALAGLDIEGEPGWASR
jgi:Tol biopolymer transport system component